MDIQHSVSTREWQQRVRQFVEQELIPWEVEAELNNGVLPEGISAMMQDKAVALGLSKMDAPVAQGRSGSGLGSTRPCDQRPVLVLSGSSALDV